MSVESHVAELKRKHAALENRLEEMMLAPSSSDQQITELKKQKLRLKEEIGRHITL